MTYCHNCACDLVNGESDSIVNIPNGFVVVGGPVEVEGANVWCRGCEARLEPGDLSYEAERV